MIPVLLKLIYIYIFFKYFLFLTVTLLKDTERPFIRTISYIFLGFLSKSKFGLVRAEVTSTAPQGVGGLTLCGKTNLLLTFFLLFFVVFNRFLKMLKHSKNIA